MDKYIYGNYFIQTDKGKVRPSNEDFADASINPYGQIMFVVADGMGGKNKGDYASKYLGKGLIQRFLDLEKPILKSSKISKWLYKAINDLNRDIYKKAKGEEAFKGMGSTLTCVILIGDEMVVAQVGDSRLYWVNTDNQLRQLTTDQTYVQYLRDNNKIMENEKSIHPERHKLTNAIGIRYNALVNLKILPYHREKLLICSDGLYNNVPFYDLQSILRSNESPERKCRQLIAFGNSNGGNDNMAVIVWESNQ